MAVVKADAYGHGMLECAKTAIEAGGEYLAVARIDEALELRDAAINHPLLVFELVRDDLLEAAITQNIELTLSSQDGARDLNAAAERLRRRAKVHIKVDTGMGRLGLGFQHAGSQIEKISRLSWLDVVGGYSHFATSDEVDQTFAREQLARFNVVLAELKRRGVEIPLVHMANSGAIMSLPESHFNMVRPGIMLYGYPPRRGMDHEHPLEPVLSFVSAVTFMKNVEPKMSISYGRRYHTREKTSIATIPVGYRDGYSRLLTGKVEALIGGKRYPVVGTICMDHLMVDVGTHSNVHEGDTVTLIGSDGNESITAWDIGEKLGTIPYEVTCMIGQRVSRDFQK